MSEDGLIWGFVLVNKPMEPRKREKGGRRRGKMQQREEETIREEKRQRGPRCRVGCPEEWFALLLCGLGKSTVPL